MVTMSQKKFHRVKVIENAAGGRLSAREAAYDIKKLRGKGMVRKIGDRAATRLYMTVNEP